MKVRHTRERNIELQEATLQFKLGGKKVKFEIVHNLEEMKLSLTNAFEAWMVRTKDFSVENFCNYVCSKADSIVCMPKSHYLKLPEGT